MDLITILILVIVIGLVIAILTISNNVKNKNKSKEVFDNLTDFKPTDIYLSDTSGLSIAYDEFRKKICLLVDYKAVLYEYKDIIQSEIDIDGVSIYKQSIGGTVGRSIVGGVIGGGVGAIIGGTSGSKTGNEKIKNIDLKITINNTKSPVYRINFMNIETKKGSFMYNLKFGEAEKWHGIITTLIKKAELKQRSSTNSNSVADEILKLKNLLDSKVISQLEFDKEKMNLLNK